MKCYLHSCWAAVFFQFRTVQDHHQGLSHHHFAVDLCGFLLVVQCLYRITPSLIFILFQAILLFFSCFFFGRHHLVLKVSSVWNFAPAKFSFLIVSQGSLMQTHTGVALVWHRFTTEGNSVGDQEEGRRRTSIDPSRVYTHLVDDAARGLILPHIHWKGQKDPSKSIYSSSSIYSQTKVQQRILFLIEKYIIRPVVAGWGWPMLEWSADGSSRDPTSCYCSLQHCNTRNPYSDDGSEDEADDAHRPQPLRSRKDPSGSPKIPSLRWWPFWKNSRKHPKRKNRLCQLLFTPGSRFPPGARSYSAPRDPWWLVYACVSNDGGQEEEIPGNKRKIPRDLERDLKQQGTQIKKNEQCAYRAARERNISRDLIAYKEPN